MTFRTLFFACGLLLTATSVKAQFSSSIEASKRNHILGEPVVVRVTLTNYTGRDQILHGQRMPWISFMVKNSNGELVVARPNKTPGAIKIGAGETLAKDFNLSQYFQISQAGNYSVSAVVRPNDEDITGTSTNRVLFQVSEGQPFWSQKVGNVGPNASTRDFRLLKFHTEDGPILYVQILDVKSGRRILTSPLGKFSTMRQPKQAIDNERHLHVLFLSGSKTFLHYRIAPTGEIVTRDMHRRATVGDPKFSNTPDGRIIVTNSLLYDPEAEAEKRAMVRKVTDRP